MIFSLFIERFYDILFDFTEFRQHTGGNGTEKDAGKDFGNVGAKGESYLSFCC